MAAENVNVNQVNHMSVASLISAIIKSSNDGAVVNGVITYGNQSGVAAYAPIENLSN